MEHQISNSTLNDIVTPYQHDEKDLIKATGYDARKLLKQADEALHDAFCEDCNEDSPGLNISRVAQVLEGTFNHRQLSVFAALVSLEFKEIAYKHQMVMMNPLLRLLFGKDE